MTREEYIALVEEFGLEYHVSGFSAYFGKVWVKGQFLLALPCEGDAGGQYFAYAYEIL